MKLKDTYLFCFLSCVFFISVAQQHVNDIDTLTVKNHLDYKLNRALNIPDYKKALNIIDSMEVYGLQNNDLLFTAYAYSAKTSIYRFNQDITNAKIYVRKSIKIYEKYNYHNGLVSLNSHLANILRAEGKLDSCFYVLNSISKRYISDSISKRNLRYYYNEKDISHSMAGRIDSSLHYTLKKIALIEKDNHYDLGISYTIMAKNFYLVKDFSKALVYINKSLDHFSEESKKPETAISRAYILKSKILLDLNRYEKVESTLDIVTDLIKKKNSIDYGLKIQTLRSKLYWKTKQFHKLPSFDIDSNDYKKVSSHTFFNFYLTNLEQNISKKKWTESKILITRLNALLPSISDLSYKQSFYKLSSLYWEGIKDFEKSYSTQNQYLKIKETINTRQQTYIAYDLDQKYQLAKKNEEIARKEFTIKEQENQLLKKEKDQIYLTLSIISAILAFITLLFIYKQRQKIKNNEILALQKQQEIVKLEALIKGEEKERNRLGQDLHDGINGDLSVIKYKITSIESSQLMEKEKQFHSEAIELLDNTVEQIRLISHNLAPSILQDFNLTQAIQQLCDKINSTYTVNINFQYFGHHLVLEQEKEISIYRIIQELVNNIIKHANATEAIVQINNHNNRLYITVEDNGKGFDLDTKSYGIGLQNIKSRVSFLNADLEISSCDQGTSIHINLDLDKTKKA
ncbi:MULTISPECIES: sensor histidine kinase [unclassified Aquimarina]|uniref:sensor histidine kinase n=1 Tax=unclassified Aquimarina TaxID=2627091 RepID=UPI000D557A54|nr:sensor histidine kinase [Aquimarina sp. Aq107]